MRSLKKDRNPHKNFRLNIIFGVFIFLFALIELRLFQIQVLSHKRYQNEAEAQYYDSSVLTPRRGNIFSSDGYTLAGNQINYLLFAEPKNIQDKYKFAHTLATTLTEIKISESTESVDKPSIFSGLYDRIFKDVNRDLMWVPIERAITPPERKVIEDRNIGNLGFEEEPIRYYPEKTLASHVLGFVASDNRGQKTGYFGIEGSLNEDLKGKSGKIMEETDAMGMPILIGSYKKIEPKQGRDVVLTIDRAVQYIVEKKLKEGVEKYDSISGSVVVMDPFTGDVLALANYPTYIPSDFSADESETDPLDSRRMLIEKRNIAISNTYEPGSVIKPMTVSAAVDLKLVTPETTYQDDGPVKYSDYFINNWDGKHYGTMNVIQLLQKSNNIGAAWVGSKVGADKLHEYFVNFGIGKKTGIDLEGEDTGILRDQNEWTAIDLATASFGQGLSTTPLQVLNAFNVIANGGFLLEPKIILKIIDGTKEMVMPTKNIRRVISKDTSNTMVNLLEKAAEGGEAKYFTLKDYRISGKTGTAQIPEGGRYSPTRTNATFVGFMTGSKKFSMIVKLEEPKTSIYAAETAVPLWMDIASELVKHFGLAPDRMDSAPAVPVLQPIEPVSITQPKQPVNTE